MNVSKGNNDEYLATPTDSELLVEFDGNTIHSTAKFTVSGVLAASLIRGVWTFRGHDLRVAFTTCVVSVAAPNLTVGEVQ